MGKRSFRFVYLLTIFSIIASSQIVSNHPSDPVIPPTPGLLEDTLTAKKLTPNEKFHYGVIEQFGVRGFLGTAVSAAIAQGFEVPEAWGPHWDGYGKRYASGFANGLSRQVFALGLQDILHEDPRYFPSSESGFTPRLRNVLKQVLIEKKDNGQATFATSRVVSALGAGFLTNTWQPKGNGSFGDGLERGGLSLVGDAAFFFLQEFIPRARNSSFRHHR